MVIRNSRKLNPRCKGLDKTQQEAAAGLNIENMNKSGEAVSAVIFRSCGFLLRASNKADTKKSVSAFIQSVKQ